MFFSIFSLENYVFFGAWGGQKGCVWDGIGAVFCP